MGKKPALVGEIGERVAALLRASAEDQGVPNSAISEHTGISEATISRLFNGKRAMYLSQLEQICASLGLSSWRIMREAEDSLALSIVSEPASKLEQDDYGPAAHNPGVDIEAEQEGMMEES